MGSLTGPILRFISFLNTRANADATWCLQPFDRALELGTDCRSKGTAMRSWRRIRSRTTAMKRRQPLHRRSDSYDEGGFTLIELVIVIVILPILVGGIAAALIAILQNESTTYNRVADSADAQLTSANFTHDVQSANLVTTSSAVLNGQCWPTTSPDWPSAPPVNAVPLLGLQWTETNTRTFHDGQVERDQALVSDSDQAMFTQADVGSTVTDSNGLNYIPSATTTPTGFTTIEKVFDSKDAEMTSNASASGAPDTVTLTLTKTWVSSYWFVPVTSGPTITYELVRQFCLTRGGGATQFLSSSIVAHDLPATAGQGIATITCASNVPASQCMSSENWVNTTGVTSVAMSADEPDSGYQFNLTAAPRSSDSSSEGVFGLLLTGSGLNESTGDSLAVNGDLDFNSTSGAAIGSGGSSLSIDPIPGQSAIAGAQCNTSCGYVMSNFAGSVTCSGSPSCPATGSLNPAYPNPPVTIQSPASQSPSGPAGVCTTTGSTTTCTPGLYASALSLTGKVTFTEGNYTFAGSVTVAGDPTNPTVSFQNGQYTFDKGLNVIATTADPVSLVGEGDLFFFPDTGSLNAGMPGTTIQLDAATTGTYAGILIDQPGTNNSSLSCSGGSTPNTLDGIVEAPAAQVSLGSNGDSFTLGTLIAASLTVSPYVNVTVGS